MKLIALLAMLALAGCETVGSHLSSEKEGWFNYRKSAIGEDRFVYCSAIDAQHPRCVIATVRPQD